MNTKQFKRGFTLIELLVVVLIIGILASVAMPQYFKSVEKSRSAEAIEIANAIANAQEREYMKSGSYTSNTGIVGRANILDVDASNLQYFTILSSGYNGILTLQRTINAGGGLGQYYITLSFPAPPGSAARTWSCSPTSAGCASMLPK